MEDNNYCNNCGNVGHVYKNCRHPILSYGIVLFHKDDKSDTKIIMIEEKIFYHILSF